MVYSILQKLNEKGHLAYLAGGCVRDALLGRASSDLDIATDATPEQVESYFEKTISVGKSFGVIRVLDPQSGLDIEVASFRKDGLYIDGRRPESVIFSDPQHDAERRDFSVNALFYDYKNLQLIDFVGGVADLKHRLLRCVGNAEHRFQEDRLRVLRLFRFQAQLDFKIEASTLAAAKAFGSSLNLVSHERIQNEIEKFTLATHFQDHAQNFYQYVLCEVFPSFATLNREEVLSRLVARNRAWVSRKLWSSAHNEQSVFVFWSLVFLSLGRFDLADSFLESLKVSREAKHSIKQAGKILKPEFWQSSFEELVLNLHELKNRSLVSWVQIDVIENKFVTEENWQQVVSRLDNFPVPFLSGADLKLYVQGAHLGALLREVVLAQLRGEVKSKSEALEWAQRMSLQLEKRK